ncbi:hypothetical protein ACFE04_010271 [Oxalis oulophora]
MLHQSLTKNKGMPDEGSGKKLRNVRLHQWSNLATEIRDSGRNLRLWLLQFTTKQQSVFGVLDTRLEILGCMITQKKIDIIKAKVINAIEVSSGGNNSSGAPSSASGATFVDDATTTTALVEMMTNSAKVTEKAKNISKRGCKTISRYKVANKFGALILARFFEGDLLLVMSLQMSLLLNCPATFLPQNCWK